MVRGADALGSAVAAHRRRRRHRPRHRRRRRNRRGGADDGHRDQPAERPADSRDVRQQVGVARQHQRGVRQVAAAGVPARVLLVARRKWRAPSAGAPWPARSRPAIHEVLGHGSGRVAEQLEGSAATGAEGAVLRDRGSARRSGGALLRRRIRRSPRSGLLPAEHQAEIVLAEYEAYARNALVQLRRVREGTTIEEDHMRNRQMIVHWLMAHTTRDRRRAPRRQDLLRHGRRRGVPRGRRAACWPKSSASSPKATTTRRGRCSRSTASTFIRRCATRSSRASTS